MGAGSFALPWAFSKSGLLLGPMLLLVMTAFSAYTIKLVIRCKNRAIKQGLLAESFVQLARSTFGTTGAGACYAASLCSSIGVCASYLVFISSNLLSLYSDSERGVTQTQLIWIILPLPVLLSCTKDFRKLALASVLGDAAVVLGMAVVLAYGFVDSPPTATGLPLAEWSTMPLGVCKGAMRS